MFVTHVLNHKGEPQLRALLYNCSDLETFRDLEKRNMRWTAPELIEIPKVLKKIEKKKDPEGFAKDTMMRSDIWSWGMTVLVRACLFMIRACADAWSRSYCRRNLHMQTGTNIPCFT